MRMWMVNPRTMCRRHLLGEHVECHMLASVIESGKSLQGFIDNGLIDTSQLEERHEDLSVEMERRGYNHQSPLYYTDTLNAGVVDAEVSRAELARRCPDCKTRQSLEARL